MSNEEILTTGDVCRITLQPEWAVRRVVDSLEPPIQKFGQNRMIPRGRLTEIKRLLRKRKTKAKQLAGV